MLVCLRVQLIHWGAHAQSASVHEHPVLPFSELLKILNFTLPDGIVLWRFLSMSLNLIVILMSLLYCILFIVHLTVSSVERRRFSKLKLSMNYLRSRMTNENFNGLASMCVKKKLLEEIDMDLIRSDFASKSDIIF